MAPAQDIRICRLYCLEPSGPARCQFREGFIVLWSFRPLPNFQDILALVHGKCCRSVVELRARTGLSTGGTNPADEYTEFQSVRIFMFS